MTATISKLDQQLLKNVAPARYQPTWTATCLIEPLNGRPT